MKAFGENTVGWGEGRSTKYRAYQKGKHNTGFTAIKSLHQLSQKV